MPSSSVTSKGDRVGTRFADQRGRGARSAAVDDDRLAHCRAGHLDQQCSGSRVSGSATAGTQPKADAVGSAPARTVWVRRVCAV